MVMAIVIDCESCGSRFRVDETLLEEAKAVRFRCRRCGGHILVRNPKSPQERTPLTGKTVPVPPGGTDLLEPILPVPAPSLPLEKIVPPTGNVVPVPPGGTERKDSLLEEIRVPPFPLSAGPGFLGDRFRTTEEIGRLDPARRASSARRPVSRPLFLLVAGLSILLLAGGTLYLAAAKTGFDPLARWLPGSGGRATRASIYEIRGVKGYVDKGWDGIGLYVLKGSATNVGNVRSNGIRIRATLLGGDNQVLMKSAVFAGNMIDETSLRHMTRGGIERFLNMREGDGGMNREIPTGKALPFMVVFFDAPKNPAFYALEALDAE